ncbi:hypothetical protein LTR29_003786 [Friedmanniomyces endolithicus]|nr:hypothetical protein LTR29_003786 [Friedmanniomyces endolithicus]
MREIVKSAVHRPIDRASEAAALMPPTFRYSLEPVHETSPSIFAGRKRKQPCATPPIDSSKMDVVDLTDDLPPRTSTRENHAPVKRRRLTPSEDSAPPPASRLDSVASLDTTRKRNAEVERLPRAAPAPTGLLSPENTPQKQREQYESLHFADSAYATSGNLASVMKAHNESIEAVVRRSTEAASDSVVEVVSVHKRSQSPDMPASAALPGSDSSLHSLPTATGNGNMELLATSAPDTPDQDQLASQSTAQPPPVSEDTPPSSRPLHQIPELAQRFIPQTSTAENIEYTNPQKFSLKPPYWKRWTPSHYARFAEHLQAQFDPRPFAQEQNLPVDEVMHCFTSVVCAPLWDADTALRRGEEGMVAQMEAVGKYGTPSRWWGREVREGGRVVGRRVFGELSGVEKGVVELVTGEGEKCCLRLVELGEEDVGFLKGMLSERDRGVLWEGHAVGVPYSMGTGLRTWTMRGNGKKAFAEVVGVGKGAVVLLLGNEKRPTIKVDLLIDEDAAYLRTVLSKRDMAILWASP